LARERKGTVIGTAGAAIANVAPPSVEREKKITLLAAWPLKRAQATYVTYREIAHQRPTENRIRIVRSTDGGQSFSSPVTVASIDPFDSTDFGPDTCGDGPFACESGLTYARFSSLSAVAADADGVHVVWSARNDDGQAKIFARNSADGLSWSAPAVQLDSVADDHQYFPDIASGEGGLSVVFQDTRGDPAYSPDLPPGNTAAGVNSGDHMNAFVASSTDGGSTWTGAQVSTAGSNPNWEVRGFVRSPSQGALDQNIYVETTP
jgi:hypothetical protein